jgi:hypothetical protein
MSSIASLTVAVALVTVSMQEAKRRGMMTTRLWSSPQLGLPLLHLAQQPHLASFSSMVQLTFS